MSTIDPSKLTPFFPPMDQKLLWGVLVGISAFSFWVFMAYFFFILAPGLASASDVANMRMEQKEERIMARHRDFCRSPRGSMQADYFLDRRNTLMREYEQIDGTSFDTRKLPDCEVLREAEEEGTG